MELTDKARDNVAAGATHGAGTSVCSKCKGAKEDTRLNSDRCATCNGAKSSSTGARLDAQKAAIVKLRADRDALRNRVSELEHTVSHVLKHLYEDTTADVLMACAECSKKAKC